ncbi:glycosyltransferase family 39 protein [Luteolibacter yonseiensis]
MGLRPLGNPDEGRYSEIPREMAATGDFVTPRLNGVQYFEKPPLVYWLSALTFRQFGVSEFTARLWGGIFAVLGVLLAYAAGRALYGRLSGVWAAIVLSTNIFYYVLSQIILLDMAVAVTITGCLLSFILAVREPRGRRRFWLFMGCYVFMALATLSKGLIGIAIPGAVMFFWLLLLNQWHKLMPFHPIAGTILLLAIAAPWHILAARTHPDFLNFYFVHEHWLRFTTRVHGRYEPWWFFLPMFFGGLFPWSVFISETWRTSVGSWKSRTLNSEAWFFLIWIVFIVGFFSISQSKLIPYILPVFPPAAVLIGRALAHAWRNQPEGGFFLAGRGFICFSFLLAVAVVIVPAPGDQPDLAARLPYFRAAAGFVLVAGMAGTIMGLRRKLPRLVIGSIVGTFVAVLVTVSIGAATFEKTSTRKFATMIKPILKPEDRVYSVGTYTQDLPVYLNRLIHVVDYRGELAYGIDAEPEMTSARFLNREDFPDDWNRPGDAYAVVRPKAYERWFLPKIPNHRVIARSARFVLVSKSVDPVQPQP